MSSARPPGAGLAPLGKPGARRLTGARRPVRFRGGKSRWGVSHMPHLEVQLSPALPGTDPPFSDAGASMLRRA